MPSPGRADGPRKPVRVLLTNDDGPTSELFTSWMTYLTEVMRWDCVAVIPTQQESFASKALAKETFQVKATKPGVWEANAPPATCVNLGLFQLACDAELVISGPNIGHNVGRSALLSSGTTGAAMEGSLGGRKAIALSFAFFRGFGNWTKGEVDQAIKIAGNVVSQLWADWPTTDKEEDKVHVFNVNVPLGFRDPQGRAITPSIAWTSIDTSSLYQSLYCKEEGGEDTYIWKPDAHRLQPPPPDTDFHTIMQGNISITALQANYVQLRFLS